MIGGEKNMTRRMANHPFNENGMVSRWEGCDAGRYGDWEWETGGVRGVVIQLSTGSHKGRCAVASGDGWIWGSTAETAGLAGGWRSVCAGRISSNLGSADRSKSTIKANRSLSCCLAVHKILVSTACVRAPFSVRLPPQFLG